MYWILKAIIFNSLLYLKTTYLLSLIFFFLFSFFWIITCYFFFLPIFFLIVVCWFFFVYFYQEWTTSFCLKCFGIVIISIKYWIESTASINRIRKGGFTEHTWQFTGTQTKRTCQNKVVDKEKRQNSDLRTASNSMHTEAEK